jgi:hypothetical protein
MAGNGITDVIQTSGQTHTHTHTHTRGTVSDSTNEIPRIFCWTLAAGSNEPQ